jgi:hypothetical protein
MDDHLAGIIKYLRAAARLLHLVIDVLSGMFLAEGPQLVADADAIGQVVMSSALERGAQGVLPS